VGDEAGFVTDDCFGTGVGTSADDIDRVLTEVGFDRCPVLTEDEAATLLRPPVCEAQNDEVAVVAVPVPERKDGTLFLSFGTRVSDDRLLNGVASAGPVGNLDAGLIDVPASQLCSVLLATPGALDLPAPPGLLQCVQARFDDTGRLGTSPASILLFVRGNDPFTDATAAFGELPDGARLVSFQDAGGWWIEAGVDGPGTYPITRVLVTTSGGTQVDVTAEVHARLGADTLAATVPGVISPDDSCG
jgi:hypothetical protein